MIGRMAAVASVCAGVALAALTVSAETEPDATTERIIVMTDGRVVRGQAQRHASGYLMERAGGSFLIPSEQIRCVARNLPDAYRQQREAMVDPTAASLIQLAEWCISYHLYDEAADELRRALRRDPDNETARKMLARTQELLLAAPAKSLEKPYANRDGLISPEVESLGGLSKETAATFTTKIQPLLMNKCGNAGCHGTTSDNGFRLNPVRSGSPNHRRSAELNLALALKYIDIHDPPHSPLLEQVRKGHGGAPATLFGGSHGAIQLKLLTDWVEAVSNERVAEEDRLAKRTPLKKKPKSDAVEPAVAATTPGIKPTVQPASATKETAPAPHLLATGTRPSDDPADAPKPIELPQKRRIDRFDPEEFNLKFASGTKPR